MNDNYGWVIEWHWHKDTWITVIPDPKQNKYARDRYHTQTVYPFKSVAEGVNNTIPKFRGTESRVVPLNILNTQKSENFTGDKDA